MKLGLVLSGGGGKGAYELGVWKALKKLKIDKYIDVFAGTSIGAFNAILFAQDDMKAAEDLWEEVTIEQLVPVSKRMLITKGVELALGWRYINFTKKYMCKRLECGIASKNGAIDIINRYLKVDVVKRRGKICYAACTELPDFKPKYFRINDYDDRIGKDIVVASASLPRIYDCTEVLGNKYIDGGISDNTPIRPVYEEGCDIIIVVLLSKESNIDKSQYPNCKIIEIIPRGLHENTITGTLNLDQICKENRIKEGFKDTMELLEPIISIGELKKEMEVLENNSFVKLHAWVKKLMFNDMKIVE